MASTETLHVKLDTDVVEKIDFIAEAETRTRNNLVKVLIAEALAARILAEITVESKEPK